MKRLAAVEQQKTFFAEEGLGETVNATEHGLRCRASNTLRKTRQKGRRLQPNVFVQEFILVLHPLLQQRLLIGLKCKVKDKRGPGVLTLTDRLGPFLFLSSAFSNSSSSTSEYSCVSARSSEGP